MTKQVNNNNGIGFLGLLAIVFITLKLTGFITWSWWWITAPLWGGFVIGITILLIILIIIWRKDVKSNKEIAKNKAEFLKRTGGLQND